VKEVRTVDESTHRRADARRNSAAILAAATECLARDPDMTLKDIAAAAGVGRVTLYGHYESRAVLVEAVVDRAIEQTDLELREVDLSGDPLVAMGRLMAVSFDLTHRFGGLVLAAQRALPPGRFQALHEAPAARVRQLLTRGRRGGSFRTDAPLAWQVMTIQALMHGAVEAVYRGDLTAVQARGLVPTTVLATLERRGPHE
jgi:AcrR family transcriptional regulator